MFNLYLSLLCVLVNALAFPPGKGTAASGQIAHNCKVHACVLRASILLCVAQPQSIATGSVSLLIAKLS